jgi:serine phosphatase RsbU (regulator of sigma subunit)
LFTDGITEAESKSEEYYGIDRLKGVVWNNLEDPEILQKIRQDLKDFTNVNRLEDDLTLLTIRRISN